MAPEGAIFSLALDGLEGRGWMKFKTWSRPEGLLAGAGSVVEDLCDKVLSLLMVRLVRVVGVFGSLSFFAEATPNLRSPRENIIGGFSKQAPPAQPASRKCQKRLTPSPGLLHYGMARCRK